MATLSYGDVPFERIAKVAVIAVLIVTVADVGLDIVRDLVGNGEYTLDLADTTLTKLIGSLSQMAIVAGVLWIALEGTTEPVVARAIGIVYAAGLTEYFIRIARYDHWEFELVTLLGPLSSVTFFLGFVLAYRALFEDRELSDWDLDRLE